MSQPFIGQLMLASFNFAPRGFVQCNGQLQAINQNQAMFSLLGTVYGGDGRTTFGLPNLQGRTPVSQGNGIVLGQVAGQETHTLLQTEVPSHTHFLTGTTSAAGGGNPGANTFATTTGNETPYTAAASLVALNAQSVTNYGGSQPHENRQPYLVMNWVISLQGIFPSQN